MRVLCLVISAYYVQSQLCVSPSQVKDYTFYLCVNMIVLCHGICTVGMLRSLVCDLTWPACTKDIIFGNQVDSRRCSAVQAQEADA